MNPGRGLAPREFLDGGGPLADLFEEDHLDFLAEYAIVDRVLARTADREHAKVQAREQLAEALVDPARYGKLLTVRRWFAEIVTDDVFAERFATALPAEYRERYEDHLGRYLRSLTLTLSHSPGDGHERCGLCGFPIDEGPYLILDIRRDDDAPPVGALCPACVREAAECVALDLP